MAPNGTLSTGNGTAAVQTNLTGKFWAQKVTGGDYTNWNEDQRCTITSACNAFVRTMSTENTNTKAVEEKIIPVVEKPVEISGKTSLFSANVFKVSVAPNPSITSFRLKVTSSSNELITVRVLDATGRLMATVTSVQNNAEVTFGANYVPGNYFAEVVQGSNRKTVQLVKL
jgi:hypothetical protein